MLFISMSARSAPSTLRTQPMTSYDPGCRVKRLQLLSQILLGVKKGVLARLCAAPKVGGNSAVPW
jgi:hypothetical protein